MSPKCGCSVTKSRAGPGMGTVAGHAGTCRAGGRDGPVWAGLGGRRDMAGETI